MADAASPAPAGLQAERTDLSWSRTSLSFAVNGSLLLMGHHMPRPDWLHIGLSGLALSLLLFALFMARRRRRGLEQRPLPEPLADPIPLFLLAAGALVLGMATIGAQLLT